MVTQSGLWIDSCRSVVLAGLADVLVRDCIYFRAIPVPIVCALGCSATELRCGPAEGDLSEKNQNIEEQVDHADAVLEMYND